MQGSQFGGIEGRGHRGGRADTCFEAFDGEGRLGQEVGVTEHVFLVHHKAQKRKVGVVDVEDKLLDQPDGVEAVVG